MRNQIFHKHINQFHTVDWLAKCVERDRNADKYDLSRKENMLAKSEFLQILADLAIRISNQNNKIKYKLPTNQDFIDFVHLYINTTDSYQSNFLKKYGILALASGFLLEQNKFKYPAINLSGRSHLLYGKYDTTIKKITGLNILEIHTIYLVLTAIYKEKERYAFKATDIITDESSILSEKNVSLFLSFFSIDMKNYNLTLKKLDFSKDALFSFRLLEKNPIIKIDSQNYVIPTLENFLYSITSNLYIHLLSYFSEMNEADDYHTEMGKEFEDYIELLTLQEFKKINKADDIVKKGDRCEFIATYNNTSIAIEVKKFIFHRDSIYKSNINDLNKLLERHIVKAYKQIENTFKYINDEKDKIGIIVIFGEISMSSAILDYLKENFKEDNILYDERIIIMSVGNYESLLANNPDTVIDVLNKYLETERYQRGEIIQILNGLKLNTINALLERTYLTKIENIFTNNDNKSDSLGMWK